MVELNETTDGGLRDVTLMVDNLYGCTTDISGRVIVLG
jgi:hypothetical protein